MIFAGYRVFSKSIKIVISNKEVNTFGYKSVNSTWHLINAVSKHQKEGVRNVRFIMEDSKNPIHMSLVQILANAMADPNLSFTAEVKV